MGECRLFDRNGEWYFHIVATRDITASQQGRQDGQDVPSRAHCRVRSAPESHHPPECDIRRTTQGDQLLVHLPREHGRRAPRVIGHTFSLSGLCGGTSHLSLSTRRSICSWLPPRWNFASPQYDTVTPTGFPSGRHADHRGGLRHAAEELRRPVFTDEAAPSHCADRPSPAVSPPTPTASRDS